MNNVDEYFETCNNLYIQEVTNGGDNSIGRITALNGLNVSVGGVADNNGVNIVSTPNYSHGGGGAGSCSSNTVGIGYPGIGYPGIEVPYVEPFVYPVVPWYPSVASSTITISYQYPNRNEKISDCAESWSLSVDVPGVKLKDVKVEIDSEFRLIVHATRSTKVSGQDKKVDQTFSMSYALPKSCDASTISAKLQDGVLSVLLMKKIQKNIIVKVTSK